MVHRPATVVLVHGAWHGAWCFDRVEWPVGHSPFANRPELVAQLLADLARRAD